MTQWDTRSLDYIAKCVKTMDGGKVASLRAIGKVQLLMKAVQVGTHLLKALLLFMLHRALSSGRCPGLLDLCACKRRFGHLISTCPASARLCVRSLLRIDVWDYDFNILLPKN